MRNYQEDIPPWKKEVLMRRDGLSKAVENETSLTNSEDPITTTVHQNNGKRQPRYRIGSSSSSLMSKIKNLFIEGRGDSQDENNTSCASNEVKLSGTLRIFLRINVFFNAQIY